MSRVTTHIACMPDDCDMHMVAACRCSIFQSQIGLRPTLIFSSHARVVGLP